MKYKAHTANSLDSETVFIQDVVKRIREQPKESERQKYYSLWYLTPMKAVCGAKRKPHFAFIDAQNCNPKEKQNSGMSIEHSTVQKWIETNKSVSLSHGYFGQKQYGEVIFSEITSEYRFNNDQGGEIEYVADIYGKIETDNILGLEPKSFLAIEIHKTSRVTKYKQAYFRKHNIAAIEITIWDKVKFNTNEAIPANTIKELNSITHNWLKKGASFKWLHNPNYKTIFQNKAKPQPEPIIKRPLIVPTSSPLPIVKTEMTQPIGRKIGLKMENGKKTQVKHDISFIRKMIQFIKSLARR